MVVLGASYDSPEDNRAFAEKETFPYRLLSDPDRTVAEAYGAAKGPEERFPGTPRRVTYLIDPEGVVRKVYQVKDVAEHAAEVLADVRGAHG